MDNKVLKVFKVKQDCKEYKVFKVKQDCKEYRGYKEIKGKLVLMDKMVYQLIKLL